MSLGQALLDRLLALAREAKLSERAFCIDAGVDPRTISQLRTRLRKRPESSIDIESFEAIGRKTGRRVLWLKNGEGPEREPAGEFVTHAELQGLREQLDAIRRAQVVVPDAAPEELSYEDRVRRIGAARHASKEELSAILSMAAQGGMGKLSDQELDELFTEVRGKPSKATPNKADQPDLDRKPPGGKSRKPR